MRKLMVLVSAMLLLSACGKKSAKDYKNHEGTQYLRKLYQGARAYYMDAPVGGRGGMGFQPLPRQFPVTVDVTPAAGACCPDKCAADATQWESMTWMALQFSVNNPHYYSYEFTSSGEGEAAKFTARAIGDLDCDGTFSTFEISAKAENGEVPPFDIDKVKLTNPDE